MLVANITSSWDRFIGQIKFKQTNSFLIQSTCSEFQPVRVGQNRPRPHSLPPRVALDEICIPTGVPPTERHPR